LVLGEVLREVVAVLEWEMCVGAVVFQSVWGGEVEQVEVVWERFGEGEGGGFPVLRSFSPEFSGDHSTWIVKIGSLRIIIVLG
jgi:hypothetical protein